MCVDIFLGVLQGEMKGERRGREGEKAENRRRVLYREACMK